MNCRLALTLVAIAGCSGSDDPASGRPERITTATPVVALTEAAANELKQILAEMGKSTDEVMLRVRVERAVSGDALYRFDIEPASDEEGDLHLRSHGLTVVVEERLAEGLRGTIIDFEDHPERRGFAFHNPNASE